MNTVFFPGAKITSKVFDPIILKMPGLAPDTNLSILILISPLLTHYLTNFSCITFYVVICFLLFVFMISGAEILAEGRVRLFGCYQ